jgi:hypothetical protein
MFEKWGGTNIPTNGGFRLSIYKGRAKSLILPKSLNNQGISKQRDQARKSLVPDLANADRHGRHNWQ